MAATPEIESAEKTLETLRSDMTVLHDLMVDARIGREMRSLTTGAAEVCVRYHHGFYTVRATPGGEAAREDLHHALAAVNNGEPVKKCRGFDCRAKGPKTLSCFSKNKTSKDGHCRYCKSCERKRVSAWKKAKRKARAAAMAVN